MSTNFPTRASRILGQALLAAALGAIGCGGLPPDPADEASPIGAATAALDSATYEQRAIYAALDAGCTGARQSQLSAQVAETGICMAAGSLHSAAVYELPISKCKDRPNRPCPRPIAVLRAEVAFGCEGEISAVVCR